MLEGRGSQGSRGSRGPWGSQLPLAWFVLCAAHGCSPFWRSYRPWLPQPACD